MTIFAGLSMIFVTLIGLAMVVMMLPGIWLIALAALLGQWYFDGDLYSWWTLGTAVGLGVLAEVVELVASAVGAAKSGGTRRGAVGSIVGAFAGAILGTPFVPPIGIIAGGAIGAGLGAVLAERHNGRMGWGDSAKVGAGAAAGRLVATLSKVAFALVIGTLLTVAAFVK